MEKDLNLWGLGLIVHSFNVVTRHFVSSATDPPQIQTNTY